MAGSLVRALRDALEAVYDVVNFSEEDDDEEDED